MSIAAVVADEVAIAANAAVVVAAAAVVVVVDAAPDGNIGTMIVRLAIKRPRRRRLRSRTPTITSPRADCYSRGRCPRSP